MKLKDLEELAKKKGFNSLRFSFLNLKGEKVYGQWLDAYFGLFKLNNSDGFIRVNEWLNTVGDSFEFEIEE